MPVTKNAMLRYGVIDQALSAGAQNESFAMTKRQLLEKVNAALEDRGIKPCAMRSIEKDLLDMQKEFGVSIDYKAVSKVRHYFYADPHMSINKEGLDPTLRTEVERVLDLIEARSATPGMGFAEEFVPIVRNALGLREGRLGGTRGVILTDHEYYAGRKWIEPLANAIRLGKVLDVKYQSFKETEPKVWRTHPHCLKQFNGRWFCVVYQPHYEPHPEFEDETAKWRRVVALDRIHGIAEVTDELLKKEMPLNREYRPDREWDGQWSDYFSEVIGPSVPRGKTKDEVVIRFSEGRAPYVWTKPLHDSQRPGPDQPLPEVKDGKMEFRYRLIPNNEFYAALLSFGPDAEVLSPMEVRNAMFEKTTLLSGLYRQHLEPRK